MKRTAIALLFAFWLPAQQGDPREAHWIRLSTPDFDLYTCAPEKEGRDLLRTFEQMRGFFQKASPVPVLDEFPIRIVAFQSKEQFSFYSPNGKIAAYYVPGPRTDYIVMQDPTRESYPFAIHEYMHLLIRHSGLRIPVWLNEGWADVYSTLRAVHGGVAVGDLLQERVRLLETSQWLTLNSLFSVTSDSRLINENARVGIFYAESWALVHMLFLSPEYSENFPKFLSALNRGRTHEEAFQAAWQKTSGQVLADLQSYMKRRKFEGRIFEVPLDKSESAVEASKLDSFDARLMLADLSVGLNRRSDARTEYESLARLRPDDMRVNEALGFSALAVRNSDEAKADFEKAFAAGDSNPLMCLKLALLESEAHQPPEKIRSALQRAIQSKPDYGDALFEMATLQMVTREYQPAIDSLLSIKKVTPQRAPMVFSSLAYCYLQIGDLKSAKADALTSRQWAWDPKQLEGTDKILALVDARAKSRFAPHEGEKTEHAVGILRAVDCQGEEHRLVLGVGNKPLVLDLPELDAIEIAHAGPDEELKLSCGPQPARPLAIDYAPASVVKEGPAGVIRRIQF